MIITRLIGGLGNQMFQYAAGRALSESTGQKLRLDLTSLRKYRLHQGYQFNEIFTGDFQIASNLDLFTVLGFRMRRDTRGSASPDPSVLQKRLGRKVNQPTHNYWEGFDSLSGPKYLSGYWQSEKYFKGSREKIAQTFTFRDILTDENKRISDNILNSTSVSVHVRRGDYVSNPNVKAFHGICEWPYYHKAIEHMRASLSRPHFFVFSDELQEARHELGQAEDITYVTGNVGHLSYYDMMLMSQCKHHIIANSSFSWWGAWLANAHGYTDDGHIVISPKNWFARSTETIEDIYMPNWLRF